MTCISAGGGEVWKTEAAHGKCQGGGNRHAVLSSRQCLDCVRIL